MGVPLNMSRGYVLCVALLAFWAGANGQRVEVSEMDPDYYCDNRYDNEFFRKETPQDITEDAARADCATYYRCVPGGGNRKLVSKSTCGFGMFFDVELQICEVRGKVDNCRIWEEGCFCSVDGTRIPGDLLPSQTPQMILITFSGAVNDENVRIYDQIFKETTKNKGNDCTAKGTFFVSHAFTNYSAVQELHRRGHEIAVGSITNNNDKNYWSDLTAEEYEAEFDGARLITERFANISQGEILGMRVPQARVGGNNQFKMMIDWGFLYDSSLAAPRGRLPLWLYTLQHRMPHKCLGTDQNCPTRNFTAWEMVLNDLDRRDDPLFSEALTGCHLVDQCANIVDPKQFRNFLETK